MVLTRIIVLHLDSNAIAAIAAEVGGALVSDCYTGGCFGERRAVIELPEDREAEACDLIAAAGACIEA